MLGCLLAVAPSQADQPIYTDSLVNGWQNWSWEERRQGKFLIRSGARRPLVGRLFPGGVCA